jgi:hypothetical protein
MTTIVLTPERRGELIELGAGRWKKQLLPLASIKYKGRKIEFDRNYLTELVKSFRERACGPVPFQLATDKNEHSNDPERRRGTIADLEIDDDGLYAIVELDEDGEKLIKQYPDLGVSARIYEDYERAHDGKFWPAALQHVLGTLDPHITGMKPWQAVALSNEDGEVEDLSDWEFDDGKEERKNVATKSTLKGILAKLRESGDEAELTDEELDQLLAITDAMSEDKSDESGDNDKKSEPAEAELTDEELDKLVADATAEVDETEEEEEEGGDDVTHTDPKLVAASQQNATAIELANAKLEQQAIELAAVQAKLAAKEFEAEQRTFATQFGIPPRITEFARPLLEGEGSHVITLSNGEEVDAGAVMRKVLTELGQTVKVLDLGNLIGTSEDGAGADDEAKQRQQSAQETRDWVKQMREQYSF